jgi:hypothetical protein
MDRRMSGRAEEEEEESLAWSEVRRAEASIPVDVKGPENDMA